MRRVVVIIATARVDNCLQREIAVKRTEVVHACDGVGMLATAQRPITAECYVPNASCSDDSFCLSDGRWTIVGDE